MTRATIAGGVFATVLVLLVLLALAAGHRALQRSGAPGAAPSPAAIPSTAAPAPAHRGFLYGRVTTGGGDTYQGRLRFGGGEEAFWDQYFNGRKAENPWAEHVPPERLKERRPVEFFGFEIAHRWRRIDLDRPFMARFGDIARIEATARLLRVTLKSGTVFDLDRFSADDVADGVRVWDEGRGVVDLGEGRIRSIEFLPTAPLDGAPERLRGTVRTRQGELSGFIQWHREACVGSDELAGRAADGELRLRFDTIRSIARRSGDGSLVTLRDGRRVVLTGTREVGDGHRGLFVDDPRYGRVLVSWEVLDSADFDSADFDSDSSDSGNSDSGPAYGDFPPGRPLAGSVTTRAGRRVTGRLVYDLDESETTETLDAPSGGLDHTIPFGRVAAIVPSHSGESGGEGVARVVLHDGGELRLDPAGDLGEGNAGMLVFADGRRPAYVPWKDVARIDFERRPPSARP